MSGSQGRRSLVAGNWKMHGLPTQGSELALAIRGALSATATPDVALFPPYTSLTAVAEALDGSAIDLGAQNMHWEREGAYTGELSAAMLLELGCSFVLIGHSERRTLFHEDDRQVALKSNAAIAAGLTPMICVGETLEQRERGETSAVVARQVRAALESVDATRSNVVLAYEPVWAIGTGRTASAAQAQEVHAAIRSLLSELYDSSTAERLRLLYGGSVKPANARELFSQPDIDGGLIGGASLDAQSFVEICNATD